MVGLKSKPFIILFINSWLTCYFGLFLANYYKTYGLSRGFSDKYLSFVGSTHSIANGCSRALWALAMDRFGFKKVYTAIIIV